MISGDELRLEQVLQNLIGNAAKYSPEGTPIRVQVEQQESGVSVAVTGRGIGIPQAALPRLFQRFYRAPNVEERISGMGVGLYVVKQIVSLHGGEVKVESVEGQGSTFTVCLPLLEDAVDAAPQADGIEANKELVRTYTQTVFNEHHTDRASDFLARNDSVPRAPGMLLPTLVGAARLETSVGARLPGTPAARSTTDRTWTDAISPVRCLDFRGWSWGGVRIAEG